MLNGKKLTIGSQISTGHPCHHALPSTLLWLQVLMRTHFHLYPLCCVGNTDSSTANGNRSPAHRCQLATLRWPHDGERGPGQKWGGEEDHVLLEDTRAGGLAPAGSVQIN